MNKEDVLFEQTLNDILDSGVLNSLDALALIPIIVKVVSYKTGFPLEQVYDYTLALLRTIFEE